MSSFTDAKMARAILKEPKLKISRFDMQPTSPAVSFTVTFIKPPFRGMMADESGSVEELDPYIVSFGSQDLGEVTS